MKPYLFDATVAPFNMRIELTPTDHAAILRVTFPSAEDVGSKAKRICFVEGEWSHDGELSLINGGKFIEGKSTQVHQDRMIITKFSLFIRLESSDAVAVNRHHGDMICFQYKKEARSVIVRIATSLISSEQAIGNLRRELPATKDFDKVLQETKTIWNR